MINIGNLRLENNILLAPMAGITDLPFRIICKEQGCGLVYSEMVSAKAILYNNKNTDDLMITDAKERPLAIQLFGSEPDVMSEAAKRIEDKSFDILDINMGCPVPKIVNNGEGSALMKNPILAGNIIYKVAKAINKPVTVKIRKGFDETSINAVEMARIAQESGAKAVAIHGRTRMQYYTGKADWNIIKQVKEAVNIPVFGNGDIYTPQDAKNMLNSTNCDGIMIARGVKGNPWLISQIIEYLNTSSIISQPTKHQVADMIIRHSKMLIELKGEYQGIREMRKHTAWYTAGFKNSSKLRNQVNEIESLEGMVELIYSFIETM